MHEHLGLEISSQPPNGLATPPATQAAAASGSNSSSRPPASTRQFTAATQNSSTPAGPSRTQAPQQHAQQSAPASNSAALNAAPDASRVPPAHPAIVQPVVAQQQPVQAPADEIAALRARIAELEGGNAHGNHPPARVPTPHQAMVADPTAVDRIRANLAGAKEEPKRPSLPALRPGHKVSALSLPIPTKVEDAFKHYRYIPYTALTHAARSRAFLRGEDSSFVFTQDGLTARGLDRSNELFITTVDWIAAAKAAEERTAHHWGDERASALVSHHLVVLDIGRTHGWSVAMQYDVQQRELAHANHEHNLAGLDVAALTLANNKISAAASHPAPSSPNKRSAPSEFPSSPRKKSHTFASNHCFRCGASGHLPADCSADTTSAGKPVAALASNARSKHALANSSGKHYCFNWANKSNCSFNSDCRNIHACSLCGDSSHGAGNCKARA